MIGGAQLTDTERPMSVSPFFAVPAQSLPSQTMYNALGHVHRHQQMVNAPARSEYSGSIFRVNFSEEGTPKGFNLVDADTKGNLTVQFCELKSAIELHNVECTVEDWASRLETYRRPWIHEGAHPRRRPAVQPAGRDTGSLSLGRQGGVPALRGGRDDPPDHRGAGQHEPGDRAVDVPGIQGSEAQARTS